MTDFQPEPEPEPEPVDSDRTYEAELGVLPQTYDAWLHWRLTSRPLHEPRAGAIAVLASGASLAVAELLAHQILVQWRRPAIVWTPVELAANPVDCVLAIVISDSLSHPDAELVVRSAARCASDLVLLTNRSAGDIPFYVPARARVVTCPRPGRDGWIATNSVLSLSLGAMSLMGQGHRAPSFDAWRGGWLTPDNGLALHMDPGDKDVLCLYTPGLRSVAVDLEARLGESGMGQVTLSDIRGLGHGRHVGVYRNAGTTSVLILASPAWSRLAQATQDSLPPGTDSRLWLGADEAWSSVELLLPSAALLGRRARDARTDPGNPRVWPGGATLFRMPVDDLLPDH